MASRSWPEKSMNEFRNQSDATDANETVEERYENNERQLRNPADGERNRANSKLVGKPAGPNRRDVEIASDKVLFGDEVHVDTIGPRCECQSAEQSTLTTFLIASRGPFAESIGTRFSIDYLMCPLPAGILTSTTALPPPLLPPAFPSPEFPLHSFPRRVAGAFPADGDFFLLASGGGAS